ncbi:MAG: hypothetical protein KGM43_11330 [Planctomycetota bacterium]|nr:hypothetical protein [Planctomycetota bacterium]
MSQDRKKKLKKRAAKIQKQEAARQAGFDRVADALGVGHLFAKFDGRTARMFTQNLSESGLEVVAAAGQEDDPDVNMMVRSIDQLAREPLPWSDDSDGECSFNDHLKFGFLIIVRVELYTRPGTINHPMFDTSRERLLEARRILDGRGNAWMNLVRTSFVIMINEVCCSEFLLDRWMIEGKWTDQTNPTPSRNRMIVRKVLAESRTLMHRGIGQLGYRCFFSRSTDGLLPITWNPRAMGIEGPNADLPVYITKHALERCTQRSFPEPYNKGPSPMVHCVIASSLRRPKIVTRSRDGYLLEFLTGVGRLGYLVVHVLPQGILIKTFLFLTMHGTPEAEMLKEKLGLLRVDIERYQLDQLDTLAFSDIADDPLLSKVFRECGCGHLLGRFDPVHLTKWVETSGEEMKAAFAISEARDGFKVGPKWMKWTATTA